MSIYNDFAKRLIGVDVQQWYAPNMIAVINFG